MDRSRRSIWPWLLLAGVAWPIGATGSDGVPIFREIVGETDPVKLMTWGLRYRSGDGVARNIDRAIRLYCKAARDGHPDAQFQLGLIYGRGEGIARDADLATAWFRLAAEQGHTRAAEMMLMLDARRQYARAACLLSDGTDLHPPPPPQTVRCRNTPGCQPARQARGPLRIGPHPARGPVATMVRRLAPDYRLDPNLVLAVIEAESAFNPQALSHKNAQGLMQLIPETAARFGVADVWDPEQNVRGGMAYLRWLMRHFDGDLELVLAAYNAGEGAVRRHGGIPPYAETQAYVARILRRLGN